MLLADYPQSMFRNAVATLQTGDRDVDSSSYNGEPGALASDADRRPQVPLYARVLDAKWKLNNDIGLSPLVHVSLLDDLMDRIERLEAEAESKYWR